jgi:hypothetical protein
MGEFDEMVNVLAGALLYGLNLLQISEPAGGLVGDQSDDSSFRVRLV